MQIKVIGKDVADKPDAEPVVSTKMISNTLEYYRYILNVTKESTKVEIENAYKQLTEKYQEQLEQDENNTDSRQIKELDDAYTNLKKPLILRWLLHIKKEV